MVYSNSEQQITTGVSLYRWIIGLLVVAGLMIWSYVLGLEVVRDRSLEVVYSQYNHIRIYEDGSYEGQTISGTPVKGCLEGALCDD